MDNAAAPAAPWRETHFDNARLARLGIEVLTLQDLRQRVAPQRLAVPERVAFFMLLLIERGRGGHAVDFSAVPLRSGSLVCVRPGQVQQWQMRPGLDGTLLLVDPAVISPQGQRLSAHNVLAPPWLDWPDCALLPPAARLEIQAALAALGSECAQYDASALGMALIRNMLTGLLLRVARAQARTVPAPAVGAGMAGIHRRLAQAIDAQVAQRPTVQQLAKVLGHSPSTLNRACLAMAGCSAKQVTDRRVALEAQRLLVHSRDAAGSIGLTLGFTEPTNFLKFFKRTVGCTPAAFRQRHAPGLAAAAGSVP
jgi:AraC-like DNA-binding protein